MDYVALSSLWLPIVVSAVLVFIASFIAWMVLPHHRSDFSKLPDEDGARAALKGLEPGEYSVPHAATAEDWKSEAWVEKATEGPNAMLTVIPTGPPKMGKSLVIWFIYCLIVGVFAAYLAGRTLDAGAHYLGVFRVAGCSAFLAYAGSRPIESIWMGRPWKRTLKDMADGLAYALLTGGVFGWLWPSA